MPMHLPADSALLTLLSASFAQVPFLLESKLVEEGGLYSKVCLLLSGCISVWVCSKAVV